MRAPAQSVPGRLRLSFTQLKQQPALLERMAASLGSVNGVITVETTSIAGALLVQFDCEVGNTPVFWDRIESVLHSYELMHNPRPLARMRNNGGDAGPAGPSGKAGKAREPDVDVGPLAHVRHADGAFDHAKRRPALMDKLMELMELMTVALLAARV